MHKSIALVLLLAAALLAGTRSAAQEFFYDLETAYVVEPSAVISYAQ